MCGAVQKLHCVPLCDHCLRNSLFVAHNFHRFYFNRSKWRTGNQIYSVPFCTKRSENTAAYSSQAQKQEKNEMQFNKSKRKKGESKGGKKGNKHVKGKRKLQKQQI